LKKIVTNECLNYIKNLFKDDNELSLLTIQLSDLSNKTELQKISYKLEILIMKLSRNDYQENFGINKK